MALAAVPMPRPPRPTPDDEADGPVLWLWWLVPVAVTAAADAADAAPPKDTMVSSSAAASAAPGEEGGKHRWHEDFDGDDAAIAAVVPPPKPWCCWEIECLEIVDAWERAEAVRVGLPATEPPPPPPLVSLVVEVAEGIKRDVPRACACIDNSSVCTSNARMAAFNSLSSEVGESIVANDDKDRCFFFIFFVKSNQKKR